MKYKATVYDFIQITLAGLGCRVATVKVPCALYKAKS